MSCIFFLHIFHIFHKEIWNIKWNENDFAGRCRWVRRIYWKKYKKIMKTERKISLKTVYVLRLPCENLLFFISNINIFICYFCFQTYIKKKTIIAVVTKSSKMNSSDADVEQSLLDDFDIHLVSIENILKPFIKQVSECPNQ